MDARYAKARSYSDEGTCESTYFDEQDEEAHRSFTRFRTEYVRPDRLHLKIMPEDPNQNIEVWSRKDTTRSLSWHRTRTHPSLDDALGTLAGVSESLSVLVPSLLTGQSTPAATYELRGRKPCGKSTCFYLVGSLRDEKIALYIDASTFALRKRVTISVLSGDLAGLLKTLPKDADPRVRAALTESMKKKREPTKVEETIEIEPAFDVAIDDSVFDFVPLVRRKPTQL
jgi:hypothetical protein